MEHVRAKSHISKKLKIFYWTGLSFITLTSLIGLGVQKGLVVLTGVAFCGLFMMLGLRFNQWCRITNANKV